MDLWGDLNKAGLQVFDVCRTSPENVKIIGEAFIVLMVGKRLLTYPRTTIAESYDDGP